MIFCNIPLLIISVILIMTCLFTITVGLNKGKKCTRPNTKDSDYCKMHYLKINKKNNENNKEIGENKEDMNNKNSNRNNQTNQNVEETTIDIICKSILVSGKNKSKRCSRKSIINTDFCKIHSKKKERGN